MYCPNCGEKIDDNSALYCGECGASLEEYSTEEFKKQNIPSMLLTGKEHDTSGQTENSLQNKVKKLMKNSRLFTCIVIAFSICILLLVIIVVKLVQQNRIYTENLNNQGNFVTGDTELSAEKTQSDEILNSDEHINDGNAKPYDNVLDSNNSFSPNENSEINSILLNSYDVVYIDVFPSPESGGLYYVDGKVDMWDPAAGKIMNLRSGPGHDYDLIDQINDGDSIILIDPGTDYSPPCQYCYIYSMEKDCYGWVLSKYVAVNESEMSDHSFNIYDVWD